MTAADILESAAFDNVVVALFDDGKAHITGDPAAISEWLPVLREHKAAILRELRHQKIAAMLEHQRCAAMVEDASTDPVIATCGIRGIATFELAIPKHSYDGMVLLELIERHSTEPRVEPSQPSGDATPSPSGNEARTAHPAGRKNS